MSGYLQLIEKARLVRTVESCTTTGDLDYPGTALEITDLDGKGLFHVVVDSKGQRQLLIFASHEDIRLPFDLVEQIIVRAKELVVAIDLDE